MTGAPHSADLSELAHEDLERLRTILERSEKEAQCFWDGAVHDLRAAHRGIAISLEMLLSSLPADLGEEATNATRDLQTSVSAMRGLLAAITSYSRCAAPSGYSFSNVDTEDALDRALAELEPEIGRAHATIRRSPLPKVIGDQWRITELFEVLIDNALKYRSANPLVLEIAARHESDRCLFSISDNGIGIDRQYWEDIFVPFRRLHGSRIPGVGLGLAIARKIADAHHGTLEIDSAPGRGTTVRFSLPAA